MHKYKEHKVPSMMEKAQEKKKIFHKKKKCNDASVERVK